MKFHSFELVQSQSRRLQNLMANWDPALPPNNRRALSNANTLGAPFKYEYKKIECAESEAMPEEVFQEKKLNTISEAAMEGLSGVKMKDVALSSSALIVTVISESKIAEIDK
ncbi:hypothetical protein N7466_011087 [Penicillium verhagenii]|uniref:uncharacterized protein n=1 Tax=Penicillium verhagenii TaxID=1562060 RepID=UPI002545ACE5|nr:uncharacterized protein N7466_011087 [Penicillium verhagenii]KAJ5917533.1 hypothetical protein N7466_011087 [Penicillium verhagenii]